MAAPCISCSPSSSFASASSRVLYSPVVLSPESAFPNRRLRTPPVAVLALGLCASERRMSTCTSSSGASAMSSLDLLSGVALAESRDLERVDPDPEREAGASASTSSLEGGVHSSSLRSAARDSPAPMPVRPREYAPSSAVQGAAPGSRTMFVAPRAATSAPPVGRAFPSVLWPPATRSEAQRGSQRSVYLHSDAHGRAVAQLHLDTTAPSPSSARSSLSSRSTAPAPYPRTHGTAHEHFRAARQPTSVPMARQPPRLLLHPGGVAPSERTPHAPRASSRLQAQPPQCVDERQEPTEPQRSPDAPLAQSGRIASNATRATFVLPGQETRAAHVPAESSHRRHESDPQPQSRAPAPVAPKPSRAPTPSPKSEPDPIVSCTLWEDERTVVMQVLVEGHVVARRADNDWINSTKLLNMVSGMTRGKRDMYLKNEPDRTVFRRGALHLKGVWLPLEAAARLAVTYGLYDRLFPLFESNIKSFLFRPINQERTTQLVRAARSRAALIVKPDISSGLTEEQREDLRVRGEALEAMLTELELGLGLSTRDTGADEGGRGEYDYEDECDRSMSPDDMIGDGAFQPLSPPPTAGLVLQPQRPQQARPHQPHQSLATSYRTRFGYPVQAEPIYSTAPPGAPPLFVRGVGYACAPPAFAPPPGPAPAPGPLNISALSPYFLGPSTPQAQPRAQPPYDAVARMRRSSADFGHAFDFRQPVAWFDNPTPPEHALVDYSAQQQQQPQQPATSPHVERERRHSDLVAVAEDQETVGWGGAGTSFARGGPPVASQETLRRLSSDTALADAFEAVPGGAAWRDCYGRSLSLPPTHRFPSYPLSSAPYDSPFDGLHNAAAPLPAPAEPTDYHTLVAQLQASLRTPPSHFAVPSPLARFSATRRSVDSAVDLVCPFLPGFGADSLGAPRSAPAFGAGFFESNSGSASASSVSASEQEARDQALLAELLSGPSASSHSANDQSAGAIPSATQSPAVATYMHTSLEALATSYDDGAATTEGGMEPAFLPFSRLPLKRSSAELEGGETVFGEQKPCASADGGDEAQALALSRSASAGQGASLVDADGMEERDAKRARLCDGALEAEGVGAG